MRFRFDTIKQQFSALAPQFSGKHLRLNEAGNLYVHASGKFSGIGVRAAKRRADKHDRAFETLKGCIDAKLGDGQGDQILKRVLTSRHYDRKLVSVADLRTIAAEVEAVSLNEQASHAQRVSAVNQELASRLNEPLALHELKSIVPKLTPDGLAALEAALARPQPPARNPGAVMLFDDLIDPQIGLMQALAKHGVIDSVIASTRSGGVRTMYAEHADSRAFGSSGLKQLRQVNPMLVQGTRIEAEDLPEFTVFRAPGLSARVKAGDLSKTGDKVHVSVAPGQFDAAWDVVLPILLKHGNALHEFKITKMDKLNEEIGAMKAGARPLTEEVQKQLSSAERVFLGGQITLYRHAEKPVTPAQLRAFGNMVREVTSALRQAGIQPGAIPRSDESVSEFCSYRNDRRPDGSYFDTDASDYAEHKKTFATAPLFTACR